jgi:hypothetical protein
MQAIHGYRETERLHWNSQNAGILQRVRDVAFPPGTPQLSLVHVLDLAEDGVIKPHIDSVRVSLHLQCWKIIRHYVSTLHDATGYFDCTVHFGTCSLYTVKALCDTQNCLCSMSCLELAILHRHLPRVVIKEHRTLVPFFQNILTQMSEAIGNPYSFI